MHSTTRLIIVIQEKTSLFGCLRIHLFKRKTGHFDQQYFQPFSKNYIKQEQTKRKKYEKRKCVSLSKPSNVLVGICDRSKIDFDRKS